MMSKHLLAFFVFAFSINANAQPNIVWMRDAGAQNYEAGKSVTTDPVGNVYVTGSIIIPSFFDSIQVSAYYDAFLSKYNSAGIIQWVKTIGGNSASEITVTKVKCDNNSNIYVCGRFGFQPLFQSLAFDSITVSGTAPYQEFAFIAKYDSTGNVQWVRYGGGNPSHAIFYDLDFDSNGNIYLCGDFSDFATFSGQTINASFNVSNAGMWAKYDANGNILHLDQTSNNTRSELYTIEVSQTTGTIFLAGSFMDSIIFNGNTTLPIGNPKNTFLVSLDNNYNLNWIRNGGGNTFQFNPTVQSMEIDPQDNIYLTGSAIGTLVQFGNLSYSGNDPADGEIMTIKYDSSGTEQWLRHGGGITSGESFDMITDSQGNSIITGFLNGNVLYATFDNDTIHVLTQSPHCYLVKYDKNGNILYAKRMGMGYDEVGRGLAFFNDTTFYLTGETQGVTQFDTLVFPASFPNPNIFIAKFYDNTNALPVLVSEINSPINGVQIFPNPFSSSVNYSFNLTAKSQINLIISDIHGRIIKTFYSSELQKGNQQLQLNLSELNAGIYFCKINSNEYFQTIKLIKN